MRGLRCNVRWTRDHASDARPQVLDANANAGVGLVVRRASESAESRVSDLEAQMGALVNSAMVEPVASIVARPDRDTKEGQGTKEARQVALFPLPFEVNQRPAAQHHRGAARCRYCSASGEPDRVRGLGQHHDASCPRFAMHTLTLS